jgi:hypothetical protein
VHGASGARGATETMDAMGEMGAMGDGCKGAKMGACDARGTVNCIQYSTVPRSCQ